MTGQVQPPPSNFREWLICSKQFQKEISFEREDVYDAFVLQLQGEDRGRESRWKKGHIIVSHKDFPEQYILAHIVKLLLTKNILEPKKLPELTEISLRKISGTLTALWAESRQVFSRQQTNSGSRDIPTNAEFSMQTFIRLPFHSF